MQPLQEMVALSFQAGPTSALRKLGPGDLGVENEGHPLGLSQEARVPSSRTELFSEIKLMASLGHNTDETAGRAVMRGAVSSTAFILCAKSFSSYSWRETNTWNLTGD